MVWVGLLENLLKVVCQQPRRTLVAVHGGRDASHIGATHPPVMAVVVAGRGHSPLTTLLVPLVATFGALLVIRMQCTVMSDGTSLLLLGVASLLPCAVRSVTTS
jgi:hypothetical protein